jgi:hypothetical protein
LYDETASLQWPAGTLVYTVTYGQTGSVAISCTFGDTICYGGDDPNELYDWGVWLDNSQYTVGNVHCTECAAGTLTVIPLTCN